MRLSVIKKPLALLLVLVIVAAISLMAVNSATSQRQDEGFGQSPDMGGGYAVPGAPGISLGPGTNTVALSVSIASQEDSKVYFQVNNFAVMDQQSRAFTVYDLSKAMPGIMDTGSNMVQIDISKLQTSIQSTSQASMNDLYSVLRPSINSLMVVAEISQQGRQGSRATFQVQSLKVIMPDGQANQFDLSQPMSIVVDGAAQRVFTSGFEQIYSLVNTYVVNIQNNYYTEINYNIVTSPVIVVSPPVIYPVLTPIRFPAAWPVYYPVPIPVPFPVVTKHPHPPSVKPSIQPTASPTGMPTVSPTAGATVSPTGKPTVSPTMKPTVSPTTKPTVSPTKKVTIGPTKVFTPTPKAGTTYKPTLSVSKVPTPKPSLKAGTTYKPTLGGGKVPTAFKPTIKAGTTYKPTLGGGGKVPTAFKPTIKAGTTYKPTLGGGGKVPTAYKPVTTKKPLVGGGKVKQGQAADVLATIIPYKRPSPGPTVTVTPTKII